MEARNIACVVAAGFIGLGLTASATNAWGRPPREAVVTAPRIDPALQRRVSYADLNLAYRQDQKTLHGRIWRTADQLCFDLNSSSPDVDDCTNFAVHSTDGQVALAIDRAKRQMAGLPVGPAIAIAMSLSGQ